MRTGNSRILTITLVLVLCAVAVYFSFLRKGDSDSKEARSPVQTVKTASAVKKSVAMTVITSGYVTAFNTVDVRPQLQNVVKAVHVKEGQDVKAGDLLFSLDERNDVANVAKAQAQLARSRAELSDAEIALKRNLELLAKGFVSQAVLDTSRSRVNAARGTVQADQAALESSKVALEYNRIEASISGRLGAIAVYPGSLAQPSGTPMVTISKLDPITVSFSVPERDLSAIRASYPDGGAPVTAALADGQPLTGKLIFIDNTVDAASGSIRMKAIFDNAKRVLWPGQYVDVRINSRTLQDAVTIPAQAVVTGPSDQFVYVVDAGDVAVRQKVNVLAMQGEVAAVTGIQEGARVVVEGAQNLRPNAKVREVQAAADPQGAKHPG
jgi:RND family efflux transporter MFP subunit